MVPKDMATFRGLITAYGLSDFAADIGVHENTAKQMRRRDSVDGKYWDAWVEGAARRQRDGITYEGLAKIAAGKRPVASISQLEARAT